MNVAEVNNGTLGPFDDFYGAHLNAVANYVSRRCSQADVLDVVAETFVVAWRRFEEIPDDSTARPWLYGVARRVLANHIRGSRRRAALSERLQSEWQPAVVSSPATTLAPLRRALDTLTESDREVLMLAGLEELSPAEIAVALELTPEAARTRLSRARSRLRAQLDADASAATTHKEI